MGELRDYASSCKGGEDLIDAMSRCVPYSGGGFLVGPILVEDIIPEIRQLNPEQYPALFEFLGKLENPEREEDFVRRVRARKVKR